MRHANTHYIYICIYIEREREREREREKERERERERERKREREEREDCSPGWTTDSTGLGVSYIQRIIASPFANFNPEIS